MYQKTLQNGKPFSTATHHLQKTQCGLDQAMEPHPYPNFLGAFKLQIFSSQFYQLYIASLKSRISLITHTDEICQGNTLVPLK